MVFTAQLKEDKKHKMRSHHQCVIHTQNSHLFIHPHTKAPHPLSPINLTLLATTYAVQIIKKEKRRRFSRAGSNHFCWYRFARESAKVDNIDTPSKREKEKGG